MRAPRGGVNARRTSRDPPAALGPGTGIGVPRSFITSGATLRGVARWNGAGAWHVVGAFVLGCSVTSELAGLSEGRDSTADADASAGAAGGASAGTGGASGAGAGRGGQGGTSAGVGANGGTAASGGAAGSGGASGDAGTSADAASGAAGGAAGASGGGTSGSAGGDPGGAGGDASHDACVAAACPGEVPEDGASCSCSDSSVCAWDYCSGFVPRHLLAACVGNRWTTEAHACLGGASLECGDSGDYGVARETSGAGAGFSVRCETNRCGPSVTCGCAEDAMCGPGYRCVKSSPMVVCLLTDL